MLGCGSKVRPKDGFERGDRLDPGTRLDIRSRSFGTQAASNFPIAC